jgi:HlyD family secretion protein
VLWSIYGSIPQWISGPGVFVKPRQITECQSLAGGRIAEISVQVNQRVEKGSAIAILDQTEVLHSLQETRTTLTQFRLQDDLKTSLEEQARSLLNQQAELERKSIIGQIAAMRRSRAELERLIPPLEQRAKSLQLLVKDGLVSRMGSEILDIQKTTADTTSRIAEMDQRMQEFDTREKEMEQRQQKLRQEHNEASTLRKNGIRQLETAIAASEVALAQNGQILSDYAGRVVEVIARRGQVISPGARIVTLELDGDSQPLKCLLYLPLGAGRRVKPKDCALVTPDMVERERYGGVFGQVEAVSRYPVSFEAVLNGVGSSEVARALTAAGPVIEIEVALQPGPESSKSCFPARAWQNTAVGAWTWSAGTGPDLSVAAGTTVQARVTVGREAPASYLLPSLRSWSGIN